MIRILTILLLILFSLFSITADAQYLRKILTSGTGYGQANGILIAYGVHIPPPNIYGHKHPVFIYMHGIDHRGARGDTIGTDGIDRVAGKGIPKLIANNPLPLMHKPGGGPRDWYNWAVFFPQGSSEFGTWPLAYESEMIKVIKSQYANVCDTNMIVSVGYSWGGGNEMTGYKDPFINSNTSLRINIAGGYNSSPNYIFGAGSGLQFYSFVSSADPTAPPSISTSFHQNHNAQKPTQPMQYIYFSDLGGSPTNDHDRILDVVMDTIPGDTYLLANGDTWTYDPTIFQFGLLYDKRRRIVR